MAKQHVAEQETLGEAMNKTEFFFEKNGRMLSYVFLGLLVLAALVFGYRALVVSPRAEKAAEMIAEAQYRFEDQNADYALALEGDANGAGFLEVIEKYGSTPSGNLAKHYAGICYLKAGDLENAAEFLARYSPCLLYTSSRSIPIPPGTSRISTPGSSGTRSSTMPGSRPSRAYCSGIRSSAKACPTAMPTRMDKL